MNREELIALACRTADSLTDNRGRLEFVFDDHGLESFAAAIATAERDALLADAERYRWLRDHMWAQSSTKIYALPISWEYSPDVMAGGYMDAAIDAARGGQ